MNDRIKIAIGSLMALVLSFFVADCVLGTVHYSECNAFEHRHVAAWTEVQFFTDADGHNLLDVPTSPDKYAAVADGQAVTVRNRQGRWTGIRYLPRIETSITKHQ